MDVCSDADNQDASNREAVHECGHRDLVLCLSRTEMRQCDELFCGIHHNLGATATKNDVGRSGLLALLGCPVVEEFCEVVQGVYPAIRSSSY